MNKPSIRDRFVFRRKIGLFGKIFSFIIVLFLAVNIINVSVVTKLQTRAVEKSLINENILLAQLASSNIESGYFTHQWPFGILKEIADAPNVIYWRIIKPDGEVYLANDAEMWGKNISDRNIGTEKMLVLDTIFNPLDRGGKFNRLPSINHGLTDFKKASERIKIIVNPLRIREGGKPWTFWLGFSLKPITVAKRRIVFTNLGLGIVIVAFASFLSFYLAKSITRPVKNLVEGTKAISNGNLNYQIETKTSDEIGELAASFNQMTQDLKKSNDETEKLIGDLEGSRAEIEKHSQDLKAKGEELSRTIAKLTDFRDATIYMLSDLDKTSKELSHQKTYNENIVATIPTAILVLDQNMNIMSANRSYYELFHTTTSETEGRHIRCTGGFETRLYGSRLEGEARRVLETNTPVGDLEFTYKSEGPGEKILNTVIVSIRFAEEEAKLLVLIDDITEKKLYQDLQRAMKELKDTQAQLIQSSKMAALGELAGGVAHQINNPLQGILGFAEVLIDEMDEDNPRIQDLKFIESSANRCSDIIESLLSFSRQSKPGFEPIDMKACIEDTLLLIGRQLSLSNIEVETEFEPNLPAVNGNMTQLQQVFLNLFLNAKDAMPEGGKLRISMRSSNDAVQVKVADTGCGIREEELPEIFEPFYTTKEVGKGTGLGLSVSYGIIQNHGGDIEVRSQEGEGTNFIVTIPSQ